MKNPLSAHFAAHLRGLQFALKAKFGAKATSETGECAIMIGPDKVDITDKYGTIIARGPAKVATVLVRKRRKAR